MAPADERLVLLPPRGALIGGIADDACGAEFRDRHPLHGVGLRCGQDDFSFHVSPGVIAIGRAIADVDEIGGDVGADAVFREGDRRGVPVGHARRGIPVAIELPQFRKVRIPCGARSLRSVEDLAIGWELLDVGVLEAGATNAIEADLLVIDLTPNFDGPLRPHFAIKTMPTKIFARVVTPIAIHDAEGPRKFHMDHTANQIPE